MDERSGDLSGQESKVTLWLSRKISHDACCMRTGVVLLKELVLHMGLQEVDDSWFQNLHYTWLCIQIAFGDHLRGVQTKQYPIPHYGGLVSDHHGPVWEDHSSPLPKQPPWMHPGQLQMCILVSFILDWATVLDVSTHLFLVAIWCGQGYIHSWTCYCELVPDICHMNDGILAPYDTGASWTRKVHDLSWPFELAASQLTHDNIQIWWLCHGYSVSDLRVPEWILSQQSQASCWILH